MTESAMTCKEAIRLLVEYLDNELPDLRRGDLEQHLSICRSCHARHEFERGLKEQIAALGQDVVRPEFRDRIRDLVQRISSDPTRR